MKRFLLLITMVLGLVAWAVAEEVTFDFESNSYGYNRESGNSQTYLPNGTEIKSEGVTLLLEKDGNTGFRFWSDGLRFAKCTGSITVSTQVNAKITSVVITSKEIGTVKVGNTTIEYKNNAYSWTGDLESVIISLNRIKSGATTITKLSVTYESALTPVNLSFAEESVTLKEQGRVELPELTGNLGGADITYTSANPEIADVEDGYIVAKAIGETTITATSAETETYSEGTATLKVIVEADDRKPAELSFGDVTEVTTYVDAEDFEAPTLTKATNADVTYSSSDENVAIVVDGEVMIGDAGTAVITARAEANDDYQAGSASYTIIVKKLESGLSFTETAIEKYLGSTEHGDFPTLINEGNITVSYTSSKPSVATVNEAGEVTILAAGETTITAAPAGDSARKYEGTASYTLTVTDNSIGTTYYSQLTDINDLVDGVRAMIVYTAGNEAMGAEMAAVNMAITDEIIEDAGEALVFTFIKDATKDGYYFLKSGDKYLYGAPSGTGLSLKENQKISAKVSLDDQNFIKIQFPISEGKSVREILIKDHEFKHFASSNREGSEYGKPHLYMECVTPPSVVAPELEPTFEKLGNGRYLVSFDKDDDVMVYYAHEPLTAAASHRAPAADGHSYVKYTVPFEVAYEDQLHFYSEYKGVQSAVNSRTISSETTGVENITVDSEAAAEYYDLQGRPVANPAKGIFIRRTGNTITKIAL